MGINAITTNDCILFLPSLVHAQPGPGGDPDVTVPVDGGLSIFAAAGIAYGAKKIKEYKKKKLIIIISQFN